MRNILFALISLISLALCLISPVLYFIGKFSERNYKLVFLVASIAWFIFATLGTREKKKA
jgi:hypothetical protein